MEINGCLSEASLDLIMEDYCRLDQRDIHLLNRELKPLKVSLEERLIDSNLRGVIRDIYCYCPEVSLVPWVNRERSRGGIHGCQDLSVNDLF